ncbi:Ig-like domain-containing protein [Leptothrix ochracea]|uniref:Ig-like domain-containing protein n=1 Tax=Leptothrix ochracea TaxID=735331 RepID=UPI0034E2F219
MNEQLNDRSATAQQSSPVHAQQTAQAVVPGHRAAQSAPATAQQQTQDVVAAPKQRRLKVGEDLLDTEAGEPVENGATPAAEAADPVPETPAAPASTKTDDNTPPPVVPPTAGADAAAAATAPAPVTAPAATAPITPAAPAAASGGIPMWAYGAGGAAVLGLAAGGGGGGAAAPGPAPDTTPPTAAAPTDITLGAIKTAANASTFNVTVAHVPADAATVKVELLNSTNTVVATTTTGTNGVYSFPGIADGTYSARVTYTDAAGNPSTKTTSATTLTPDTIAPTLATAADVALAHTLVSAGTSNVTVTLANVPTDAATVKVELLDSTGAVVGTTTTGAAGVYTLNNIADGAYTTRVTYTDAAGNAAVYTPTASNLGLDTIAPVATNTAVALAHTIVAPGTSNVNVTLTGVPADAATTKVELLDSTGAVVGSTTTGTAGVYTLANVADGAYTTRVSYTDAAGNTSTFTPTTSNLSLDSVAPTAAVAADVALAHTIVSAGVSNVNVTLTNVPTDAATIQVELLDSAGAVVNVTPTVAGGVYTFAGVADGTYTTRVSYTDAAGNTSTYAPTGNLALDTIAPVAAVAGDIALAHTIVSPGVSNVDVTLTNIPTDAVTVKVDLLDSNGVVVGSTTTGAAGVYTLSNIADGAYTTSVSYTDAAGNTSTFAPSASNLSIDTIAPTAAVLALANGATTPTTTDGTLTVSGLEVGATVDYMISSATVPGTWAPLTGTTIASPPTNGTADGLYSVQVRQTDAAGNQSVQTYTYTLNTQPIPPAVLSLVTDSGVAGDLITNSAALNVTTDPSATLVEYNVTNNGVSSGWTTSYTAPTSGDGTTASAYTVDVRQTDARLTSSTSSISFTLDTVAPTAATLALTSDTNPIGVTALDGITKSSNISVTGLNGSTIQYRLIETTTGVSTSWASVTADATGAATITGPTVDGNYTLEVQQADVAGNLTTNTLAFSIDNAIVAPIASVVDTGSKDLPIAITTNGTVTLSGLDPHVAQVIYRVDGAATWTTVDVTALSLDPVTGLPFLTIPSVAMDGTANGLHTVDYYQVDLAGNSSTPALIQYTMDVMPLGLTAPVLALNNPGPNPSFTNNGAITVTGLDPSVSQVMYGFQDPATGAVLSWLSVTPTFNALTGLPINATIPSPGAAGSYVIEVYQVDQAGNSSSVLLPATLTYTLDNAITGPALVLAQDTGLVPGAGITQVGNVTVSNLDPNTYSVAYTIAAANGSVAASGTILTTGTPSATIAATDSLGNPLPDGFYQVTVTETDQAGNTFTQTPLSYTLDTLPPSAPTLGMAVGYTPGAAVPLSVPVTLPLDVVVGDQVTVVFTDTNNVAAPFFHTVTQNDLTTHTAKVAAGSGLLDGTYTVSSVLTDAAGNATPSATSIPYTLDTIAPVTPSVSLVTNSGSTTDTITNTDTLHLVGVEAGAQVEYRVTNAGGTVGAWLGATPNPAGNFTPTLPADGTYTIEVRQRDAAGNISTVNASSTLTLTLDTTLLTPTVGLSTDSGAQGDGITNNNGLNIGNVVEAGATATYTITAVGSATPAASGSVVIDALGNGVIPHDPALANGAYVATVTSTDIAGNTKTASVPFTFDNVALAPVVTLTSDTGVSATDSITKVGTYTVTGVETGATLVEYSTNGTTWSTTAPTAAAGLNDIYVRQTDAAGNVSPVVAGSPNLHFTLDTAPPAALTVGLGTDTGITTDKISSLANIAITGVEAGAAVTYTIDGNATVLSTGLTADGSFLPTDAAGAALANGAHTVVVTQTDLAGNATSTTLAFTLDTQVATLGLALVNDTGVSSTDKITSVGSVKLVDPVTGLGVLPEAGSLVEYGTMVGGVLTWSTTFLPAPGVNDVWVRQTDVAGNVSTFNPAVSALTFTMTGAGAAPTVTVTDTGSVDTPVVTTTPDITVAANVAGSVDFAYSMDGGVNWTPAPAPAGGLITIPTAGDGTYTVMVHSLDPVSGAASGDAQVTFIQDTAATVITAALAVDSFKAINDPNGTGATDTITNDGRLSIINADPNLDSVTVTYTHTDAAGVVTTQTITALAVAVADPANPGQFIATIPAPTLGDGAYSADVYQTDKAGNTTLATPVTTTFTLDTTLALPLVTLTTDTANPANAATALDGITNLSNLLVANVEPGASVDFTVTDATGVVVGLANNTVVVDPLTNTAAILAAINTGVGGSPDGTYTVTVTQTDVAGNQQSQALPLVIDTAISTLTAVLATDTASALNPAGTTADKISQVGDVLITGLDPHVDVVTYTLTPIDPLTGLPNVAAAVTNTFVPTPGATSYTLTAASLGLVNGTYDLTLDQIDKAGNNTVANGTTTTFTFTYDTVALPPVSAPTLDSANPSNPATVVDPILGPIDTNGITNVSDLTLSGLEVGAAVTYTITNTLTGAVVVPSTVVAAASIDPVTHSAAVINPIATNPPVAGANDGTYLVTVTQTDLAGNTNTGTNTYTIDTVITSLSGSVSLNGVAAPIPDGVTIFDHVGTQGQITLNGLDPNVDQVYYVFTPVDPISGISNGSPTITGSMVPTAGATSFSIPVMDPALALADGAYTVDFWQVDKAGNSSLGVPVTMNFTLDTVTTVPQVVLLNDTGDATYNPATLTDGITADPTPNPQGGTEVGGVIEYSLDGITWVQGTAITSLLTGDGAYGFFVRQTDAVGNVAMSAGNTAATGGYEFIYDATKPALNLAADPATSAVVGGVIHSSTGAITIAAGVDPHPSTYVYSIDAGVTWTPNLSTLPATIVANGVLSGQTINVDVIQIDAAGNGVAQMIPGGKDARITMLIDTSTTMPTAHLTTDSGLVATDGVSNQSAITAVVTEAGAALQYSINGGAWAPWTGTYAAPTVDPVTQQVIYAMAFQQTDALGNVSPVNTLQITLDTGAAAPGVQVVMDALGTLGGTGSASALGLLSVTGEPGASFQVNTGAGWQDISTFVPVVGANNVQVQQTDAAGNVSLPTAFSFTLNGGYAVNGVGAITPDATVNQPSISMTDTGVAGDHITNNGTLTITPQNVADLVEFSQDNGNTWIDTATLGMPLGDGTYTLLFRESNQTPDPVNVGTMVTHYSPTTITTLTVDTLAPTLVNGTAELFTSATGATKSVAVLQLQYAEGATVDTTNMATFAGAGALRYATAVVSSGMSMDGLSQLGLQADGTTLVELQFTETVKGSFTQATITPVGQLAVHDLAGNSTSAAPAVDLTVLGATWQLHPTLP